MSEETHVCEKHQRHQEERGKYESRVESSKHIDEVYLSLDKKTKEMVDYFIDEFKKVKGDLNQDIENCIWALEEKGCVRVRIAFLGITSEGEKIVLDEEVAINFEQ